MEKWKIMVKIVATYVVASGPPNGDRLQRRPLVQILRKVCKKIWGAFSKIGAFMPRAFLPGVFLL